MKEIWDQQKFKIAQQGKIFVQPKCPFNKGKIARACTDTKCNKSSLMCNGDKCNQCYKNHQKCQSFFNFNVIQNKLKKDYFGFFQDVLKFYFQIAKTAIKQYNVILDLCIQYQFKDNFQKFVHDLYRQPKSIKSAAMEKIKLNIQEKKQSQINISKAQLYEKINLKSYKDIQSKLKQPRQKIQRYKNHLLGFKDEEFDDKIMNVQEPSVIQIIQQKQQVMTQVKKVQDKKQKEKQHPKKEQVVVIKAEAEPKVVKKDRPIQADQNKNIDPSSIPKAQQSKAQQKVQNFAAENQLPQKQKQQNQQQQQSKQIKAQNQQQSQESKQNQKQDQKKQPQKKLQSQLNKDSQLSENKSFSFETILNNHQNDKRKELGIKMTDSIEKAKQTQSMMIDESQQINNQNTSDILKSSIMQYNNNMIKEAQRQMQQSHFISPSEKKEQIFIAKDQSCKQKTESNNEKLNINQINENSSQSTSLNPFKINENNKPINIFTKKQQNNSKSTEQDIFTLGGKIKQNEKQDQDPKIERGIFR